MEHQTSLPPDTANLPQNGHPKTSVLSSNSTLFWRVFAPVFSVVFLSGLTLALWLSDEEEFSLPFAVFWPRLLLLALWAGWIWFIRSTLWRLKRVDADDTHLYVTNYWTTLRYPWADVARIEEKKRLGRRIINLWLKSPGRFGQVISFLPGSFFDEWKNEKGNFSESATAPRKP